jgi:hypothetical protein
MGVNMSVPAHMLTTDNELNPKARAYIVYDKETSKILHIHHTVTFPHAYELPESPEAHAIRLAGKRARTHNAAVLEVDPNDVGGIGANRGALLARIEELLRGTPSGTNQSG